MTNVELERIRKEYARRQACPRLQGLYSPFQPGSLYSHQSRERVFLDLLRRHGIQTLAGLRILDVGCGTGGELRRLIDYGAAPENMFGLDLLSHHVAQAKKLNPGMFLVSGNGANLPYLSASFDLVTQLTVFSSILDDKLKQAIAAEMLRVLKPGGMILWYDYWLNPVNPATRGVRPAEVRWLFSGCRYEFQRITLAPPIARILAGHSWLLCYLLEKLWVFNTHYLAAIRPRVDS